MLPDPPEPVVRIERVRLLPVHHGVPEISLRRFQFLRDRVRLVQTPEVKIKPAHRLFGRPGIPGQRPRVRRLQPLPGLCSVRPRRSQLHRPQPAARQREDLLNTRTVI